MAEILIKTPLPSLLYLVALVEFEMFESFMKFETRVRRGLICMRRRLSDGGIRLGGRWVLSGYCTECKMVRVDV